MSGLTRTAIAIEKDLLRNFDRWMARHGYGNRSQALRDLVRAALVEDKWQEGGAEVVAALSVIYDHERRELAQHLTHMQHEDHRAILCSQHVHLDAHNCLEVIVMRGPARQLRRISDAIIATRDVRAAKLSLLSRNV